MNTLRKALCVAALGCLLPVSAFAENDPRPGRGAPEAADNTLGMALMGASVNSNGSLSRGTNVVSSAKLATGAYGVKFDRNIQNCFYVASVGQPANGFQRGFAATALRAGTTDSVYVGTNLGTAAANPADAAFHLIVFCPK